MVERSLGQHNSSKDVTPEVPASYDRWRTALFENTPLTPGEQNITLSYIRGLSPGEIAEEHGISRKTVSSHIGNTRKALGVPRNGESNVAPVLKLLSRFTPEEARECLRVLRPFNQSLHWRLNPLQHVNTDLPQWFEEYIHMRAMHSIEPSQPSAQPDLWESAGALVKDIPLLTPALVDVMQYSIARSVDPYFNRSQFNASSTKADTILNEKNSTVGRLGMRGYGQTILEALALGLVDMPQGETTRFAERRSRQRSRLEQQRRQRRPHLEQKPVYSSWETRVLEGGILTNQQQKIVLGLLKGSSQGEIAEFQSVTSKTVNNHIGFIRSANGLYPTTENGIVVPLFLLMKMPPDEAIKALRHIRPFGHHIKKRYSDVKSKHFKSEGKVRMYNHARSQINGVPDMSNSERWESMGSYAHEIGLLTPDQIEHMQNSLSDVRDAMRGIIRDDSPIAQINRNTQATRHDRIADRLGTSQYVQSLLEAVTLGLVPLS